MPESDSVSAVDAVPDSDINVTTAFLRCTQKIFEEIGLPNGKINLFAYVQGNLVLAAAAGASITKVEARLVNSSDATLATFSLVPPTLTNDLLELTLFFTLRCKVDGISNTRLIMKVTDVDPAGVASSASYTKHEEVATDFDWPTDGIVFLEVSATGASFRFNISDFVASYEERLYYA